MQILAILMVLAGVTAQRSSQPAQPAHPEDEALRVQVALDRAGFSPGPIDGRMGRNTRLALETFKAQGGNPDASDVEPLVPYTITAEDARGPYVSSVPTDLVEQSKLPALSYRTALEALAERFHATPDFLRRTNPSARFAEGEEILVPNVEPFVAPVERLAPPPKNGAAAKPTGTSGRHDTPPPPDKPDVVVTVTKSTSALTVKDAAGKVIFFAPVTTGSEHDPLPIGEWKVNGVEFNPKFRYNPDLFWDADPSHTKATIPPGPNNPVGLVWIDLSKPHYGIHGTPEPEAIGRTQSHGCVRMTNWDALKLAGLVKPGTRVFFTE
jgi:lipoprotein-anchoring transpeptidase ErfK/SrfK